jgi:hypothetical protein
MTADMAAGAAAANGSLIDTTLATMSPIAKFGT